MADDGIRERHGCACRVFGSDRESAVGLNEIDGAIVLAKIADEGRELSPEHARYLGRKLLRLARRVEQRNAQYFGEEIAKLLIAQDAGSKA